MYLDGDIPSYIWESLLRSAGMYSDDPSIDIAAAFVKEASIFDPHNVNDVHTATDRLVVALDQNRDSTDDALAASNCGLFALRADLRNDPLGFGQWAALADLTKGEGGDALRMFQSYVPKVASNCAITDEFFDYPETILKCILRRGI